MARAQDYLWLNDKYLKEAGALMEEGDYVQASEKFWGAAAEIVKAVAAGRDVEIRSHGQLHGSGAAEAFRRRCRLAPEFL